LQFQLEIIGEIDQGIQAASWSPDDSSLVLITGEGKLVIMNTSFDTLWEGPVETDEFGVGMRAINLIFSSLKTRS
jgi:elongator complex protein 1